MYGSAGQSMTVEEFERLPDDGWRQELVRGSIVMAVTCCPGSVCGSAICSADGRGR